MEKECGKRERRRYGEGDMRRTIWAVWSVLRRMVLRGGGCSSNPEFVIQPDCGLARLVPKISVSRDTPVHHLLTYWYMYVPLRLETLSIRSLTRHTGSPYCASQCVAALRWCCGFLCLALTDRSVQCACARSPRLPWLSGLTTASVNVV